MSGPRFINGRPFSSNTCTAISGPFLPSGFQMPSRTSSRSVRRVDEVPAEMVVVIGLDFGWDGGKRQVRNQNQTRRGKEPSAQQRRRIASTLLLPLT